MNTTKPIKPNSPHIISGRNADGSTFEETGQTRYEAAIRQQRPVFEVKRPSLHPPLTRLPRRTRI